MFKFSNWVSHPIENFEIVQSQKVHHAARKHATGKVRHQCRTVWDFTPSTRTTPVCVCPLQNSANSIEHTDSAGSSSYNMQEQTPLLLPRIRRRWRNHGPFWALITTVIGVTFIAIAATVFVVVSGSTGRICDGYGGSRKLTWNCAAASAGTQLQDVGMGNST